mmetsp:Transcript_8090/g.24369  ORF Transcript_8090/g.24369 Transcript_8090/m.24369 type:complete len:525 (+) Transcript_8090:251-1825(+)
MAMEYRHRFRKDVVVDIFCYRRHGHNELDQPMFTQPLMYKKIKDHPTPVAIYSKRLIQEGSITEEEVNQMKKAVNERLNAAFQDSKTYPERRDYLDENSSWGQMIPNSQYSKPQPTGVPEDVLLHIGNTYTKIPPNFKIHPLLKKQMQDRREQVNLKEGIDWANAEALAFGSLLLEDIEVRLSGQDSERGTFSQRHAVWHDQESGAVYTPLNTLGASKARLQIANSNLSEMAVLGFEQGFALESPDALVCWEAQFGDFVNGAQVILDTFISAGERKWRRQSGLTLLLPHGYEGQGPEHSSARMERFLQMSDDDPDTFPTEKQMALAIQQTNMQIVNPSTPANYFHILRRQIHRRFRKPCIIFTPKSLLRHPQCKSNLKECADGTSFKVLIDDPNPDIAKGKDVKRLVFCSGKVYYDLIRERGSVRMRNDIRFVRMEQLAPFPFLAVRDIIKQYPKADLVWVQEESKNMGAWSFVHSRFETTLNHMKDKRKISYAGRPPSAAPATGNAQVHKEEVQKLMDTTFKY